MQLVKIEDAKFKLDYLKYKKLTRMRRARLFAEFNYNIDNFMSYFSDGSEYIVLNLCPLKLLVMSSSFKVTEINFAGMNLCGGENRMLQLDCVQPFSEEVYTAAWYYTTSVKSICHQIEDYR